MIDFELTYHQFSERSILVQWPQRIDKTIHKDVLLFKNHLEILNIKSILQVNIAYNSILIIYKYTIDKFYDDKLALNERYLSRKTQKRRTFRHWKIPVCYDEKFAIDLNELSHKSGLREDEIIAIHSSQIYTVFFIGFLPGFLYLGGLDKKLNFPRKKTPRKYIEKGSVGIGNNQTGIYPNSSPAGWQIIGNSPLNFFDTSLDDPCFAKSGDTIEFVSITYSEYLRIKKEVEDGTYNLETDLYNA